MVIVGFNKNLPKSMTKAQFVKAFKDIYPQLDLEKEYDKLSPPKTEKAKK